MNAQTPRRPKRLITHSEDFHTDDVFATALLLDIYPDAEVVRSRKEADIETGDIVFDVGKVYDPEQGRFDHHQAQAGKRDNGIIYSSFGLLWLAYGLQFCNGDQDVWDIMDKQLVMPIDANDNGQKISKPIFEGVEPFTIDAIISTLNPQPWVEKDIDYDNNFMRSVEFAWQILDRLRAAARNSVLSQQYLLEMYAAAGDKRLLVSDKKADVSGILKDCPELLYVVSPRPSGDWGVLAVSTEAGSFTPRRPFPEAWRAQPLAELKRVSGVPDAVFCHATGFFAVAKTREGAITLAKRSLES